eukprot:630232_1
MTTAVIRSRYLGETCGSSSECADGCACPTGICKNDQTKKRCPANPLKRPQTAAQIEEMIRTENVSPLKRPQTAAQIEEMIRTENVSPLKRPQTAAQIEEKIQTENLSRLKPQKRQQKSPPNPKEEHATSTVKGKATTVAKAYEQIYGDDYVQHRGVGGYIPMYDAPYHYEHLQPVYQP